MKHRSAGVLFGLTVAWLAGVVMALATAGAVAAPVGDGVPVPFEEFQERVYALFLCSAGANTEQMQQGWGLPEKGYRGFNERYAAPIIQAGFTRFHMHLPDGFYRPEKDAPVVMPFDARVDSQEHGYHGAADFAWMIRQHPDIVWLHYFGSLDDVDLRSRADEGRWSSWLHRLRQSVMHTIDLPNVEYGFDASTKWTAQSPEWAWLTLLRNIKADQGRDCFIESLPRVDRPNTHGWPVIALKSWFDKIQAAPQWEWDLPLPEYPPGTRIHIMDVERGGRLVKQRDGAWIPNPAILEDVATGVRDVLSRGEQYTVAIRLDALVDRGYTARDLYEAVYHLDAKPIFDVVWAADPEGLRPAHFQPNNFRLYDALAKTWVPNTIDPERTKANYAPDHKSFVGVGDGPILLDFEFDDDIRRFDEDVVNDSIKQMVLACEIIRELHPQRPLIPYRIPLGIWPSKLGDESTLKEWQAANDRLAASVLPYLDATAPVLYWTGQADWYAEAEAAIAEARRLAPDKPCYPWFWFQRHDSVGPAETRGELLPIDECARMVSFILEHADGVILFSSVWTDEHQARLEAVLARRR